VEKVKMSQTWNPLQDLIILQDRMNRLFEDATQRRVQTNSESSDEFERADWTPAADIYESEAGYSILLDLPGIQRDDVQIDLDDNRLTVRGNREIAVAQNSRSERPRGKFLRTFSIPPVVDQKTIDASYKDGVLQIKLPRRAAPSSQKIEIKIS
jgi:HSP20 family protein